MKDPQIKEYIISYPIVNKPTFKNINIENFILLLQRKGRSKIDFRKILRKSNYRLEICRIPKIVDLFIEKFPDIISKKDKQKFRNKSFAESIEFFNNKFLIKEKNMRIQLLSTYSGLVNEIITNLKNNTLIIFRFLQRKGEDYFYVEETHNFEIIKLIFNNKMEELIQLNEYYFEIING